jgi:tetratricopeptide (TPR) repeat protein
MVVVLAVAVCLFSSRSHAQVASPTLDGPTLTEEQARSHFNTGSLAFSAGRFADALSEFQKSYALSGRPKLLYNIGVASDRLRRDREALAAFEQYLEQVPAAPERAEVEARIAVLRGVTTTPVPTESTPPPTESTPTPTTVAPQPVDTSTTTTSTTVITEVVPAEPVESTVPAETRAPHPSVGQWLALGASGVVAVAGGVLFAIALIDKSTVESVADGGRFSDIESAHDRVPLLSTLGGVMLGVGLAGAAAATTWIVVSGDDHQVEAQVGLGHLSVRGTF